MQAQCSAFGMFNEQTYPASCGLTNMADMMRWPGQTQVIIITENMAAIHWWHHRVDKRKVKQQPACRECERDRTVKEEYTTNIIQTQELYLQSMSLVWPFDVHIQMHKYKNLNRAPEWISYFSPKSNGWVKFILNSLYLYL